MRRSVQVCLSFVLAALCASEVGAACTNGTYLTAAGFVSAISIEELSQRLRQSAVDHVYVYRLNPADVSQRSRLPRAMDDLRARLPGVTLVGMIGRIGDPATTLKRADAIWKLGFDGIQIDFEPVASGDRNLPAVLALLRDNKPKGKIVSLAGYLVNDSSLPHPGNGKLLVWDQEYYRQLIPLVDDLMVMNYDTAIRSRERYVESTAIQTRKIRSLVNGSRVRLNIGIITDVPGRTGMHDRNAENFSSALAGIRSVWPSCPDNAGVALFTWDGMNLEYWRDLARWSQGPASLDPAAPAAHSPQRAPARISRCRGARVR